MRISMLETMVLPGTIRIKQSIIESTKIIFVMGEIVLTMYRSACMMQDCLRNRIGHIVKMEPHVPTVHTLQTTMPPIALILARRMILLVQHGDLRRILFKQLQRHTSLIIKLPRRSAISILGTLVFCVEAMVLHTTHLSVLRQVARLSK